MDFPIPAVVQLTIPDDGAEHRVEAALGALADRILNDEPVPAAEPDPPERQFYVRYSNKGWSDQVRPEDLGLIALSLDPERVPEQASREARSVYLLEGSFGLSHFRHELMLAWQQYGLEGVNGVTSGTLPNASSFDTFGKIQSAVTLLAQAHDAATRDVVEQAKKAVVEIGERAVTLGRDRLVQVRSTTVEEAASYFDVASVGHRDAEEFLRRETQSSRAFLRGPGIGKLAAAIREVDTDRSAVLRATASMTRGSSDGQAQADFVASTTALAATVEAVCDDHPVLYRIWDRVSLTADVYVDARGELRARTRPGADSVARLREQLFTALSKAYRANVGLHADLSPTTVWELSPLIDAALEDLGQAGHTVGYRAAQERLESEERMSVVSILSTITGVLEMGGLFLAAEPPVLLVLGIATAVLSLIDVTQQYFELRTKDRAHLASLDPQLSWATDPSYVGFYVSIACALLDLKGVRDAVRGLRAARVAGELADVEKAIEAFGSGVR